MMRNWIIIGSLLFVNVCMVRGQATNPELLEAILMFEKGKYYQSVHEIASLLQKDEINEADLPKANFFLGQSYLGLIRENPRFRKKNPFAVARAYTHTETAHMLGHGGRYTDLANSAFQTLQPYLYNEGVYYFNKEMYVAADYYFGKAVSIDPRDHEAIMARSLVALAEADTPRAILLLQGMTKGFASNKQDSLPSVVREAYSLLATYSDYAEVKPRTLAANEEAEVYFPKAIPIETAELKVYQDQPLKQKEAIRLFEDVLGKFPEDTESALAYADLLQFMGKKDTAMKLYEQVLRISPNEMKAHKGLAVHQLNKAVSMHEKMKEEKDSNMVQQQEKSIDECLNKAWPHFLKLHQSEPGEELWLKQLAFISMKLGKPGAETYVKKLKDQHDGVKGKQ